MARIATEQDVIDDGGAGIWTPNKCCTRAKAETLGMEMKSAYTSYAAHQLIPEGSYKKESVTPSHIPFNVRWHIRGSLNTTEPSPTLHIGLGGTIDGTGPAWVNGTELDQTMPFGIPDNDMITIIEIESDGPGLLASPRIVVTGSGQCVQAVPNFVKKITLTLDEPIRVSDGATYTFNIQLNG